MDFFSCQDPLLGGEKVRALRESRAYVVANTTKSSKRGLLLGGTQYCIFVVLWHDLRDEFSSSYCGSTIV